jgi:hypothetical protein
MMGFGINIALDFLQSLSHTFTDFSACLKSFSTIKLNPFNGIVELWITRIASYSMPGMFFSKV